MSSGTMVNPGLQMASSFGPFGLAALGIGLTVKAIFSESPNANQLNTGPNQNNQQQQHYQQRDNNNNQNQKNNQRQPLDKDGSGPYNGRRQNFDREPDESSSTTDDLHSFESHFDSRVTRFIRVMDYLVDQATLLNPIESMIDPNGTSHQDIKGNLFYHAAHMVIGRILNNDNFLISTMGHTQIQPREYNEPHGPGGAIDTAQRTILTLLINRGMVSNEDIINIIQQTIQEFIDRAIRRGSILDEKRIQLLRRLQNRFTREHLMELITRDRRRDGRCLECGKSRGCCSHVFY